jgi:hypothetical protein
MKGPFIIIDTLNDVPFYMVAQIFTTSISKHGTQWFQYESSEFHTTNALKYTSNVYELTEENQLEMLLSPMEKHNAQ